MKRLFLFALLLFPLNGISQSAQRYYTALLPNTQGDNYVAVIPNASIYICQYNDQDQCLTPQPVYSDTALTQPLPYPFLADGSGVYSYYIQSGTQVIEKVCAPYDQCSSYQVQVGDKVTGGGGSGTVTSVSCGPLSPIFTCAVSTATTTPALVFTLDNAVNNSFLGNIQGTTGPPSYVTLVAGSGIVFTPNTGSNTLTLSATGGGTTVVEVNGVPISPSSPANFVNTLSVNWAFTGDQILATAASGCLGTLPGDNTSTDCGYHNRLTDTAANPANDSTFGYTNLDVNTATKTVAMGTLNGAYLVGSDNTIIGDSNAWGNSGSGNTCSLTYSVVQGLNNLNGSLDLNTCAGTTAEQMVLLGQENFNYAATPSSNSFEDVAIGAFNFNSDLAGQDLQNLGIQNGIAIGNNSGNGLYGADIICVGDSACDNHAYSAMHNVNVIVGIGTDAMGGMQPDALNVIGIGEGAGGFDPLYDGLYGTQVDEISVGDDAGTMNTGNDTVALGNTPLAGIHILTPTLLAHNTGSEIIAIGTEAGRAQTTGSFNIYLGDEAGCVGCSSTVVGNGNQTGSHNVIIGSSAGPNTTTQLSNTVAIGWNANTLLSNQTVIGNSSVTSLKLFGCPSGQVVYDDGTGTCFTPAGGGGGTAAIVASAEVVSFSATPVFSTSFNTSRIVLTGNITSFTLGSGADGQNKTLCFKQGAGPFTVVPPANVHGFFTVGTVNADWNCQTYNYDGTDSIWLATSTGVINE